MSKRLRVDHTEEWALIEPLLPWHEQREYELLRPIVVFGDTPAERARQTGAQAAGGRDGGRNERPSSYRQRPS